MNRLPIDDLIPEIESTLQKKNELILQATPGSGKTTRVPPALLNVVSNQVWVLEPRRLAAKYAASRVSQELGERVGTKVGYQFRFEKKFEKQTRLLYLTEGVFLRRLLSNPSLDGVGCVVLDEFHERSLQTDLAIAYLKDLRSKERKDLKVVVMSATLDTQKVSSFLDNAPILDVEAPTFPVERHFADHPPANPLPVLVKNKVNQVQKNEGDILVFLPGMGDIRRAAEALKGFPGDVFPLHGDLSFEEQSRAIEPGKRKKVILATNVAETSLTIQGIRTVIDSGLHRQASFSRWSGLSSLLTAGISQASATQRAGRAGRTAPGACHHLFTKKDHDQRPRFEKAEIFRTDLAESFLLLSRLARSPETLPWFESPETLDVKKTLDLLKRLGAIDDKGLITETGQKLSQWPLHPRLGRFLFEATERGCYQEAAHMAAMLSEGDTRSLDLHQDLARPLSRNAKRLFERIDGKDGSRGGDLGAALLTAFPDRVAKRKKGALLFSQGGSGDVDEHHLPEGDFFVTLGIREIGRKGTGQTRLQVQNVYPISEDLLWDSPSISEETDVQWDSQRRQLRQVDRVLYDKLVLEEREKEAVHSPKTARVLLKEIMGIENTSDLNEWHEGLKRLLDKKSPALLRLAQWKLLLEKGKTQSEDPGKELTKIAIGCLSEKDLKDIDWAFSIQSLVTEFAPHEWESWLPTQFTFPNGRRSKIYYPFDGQPHLASRLQDFFGMEKGPSILKGQLPLLLHLLAPNQRPAQITQDLESFWNRTYTEVRKELRRRYPKHAWPEDPRKG